MQKRGGERERRREGGREGGKGGMQGILKASSGRDLANKLNFLPLDILDRQNLKFRQEMQTQIIDGIPKNRFLNQENVTSCFLDFFTHVQEIGSLFFENLVHLSVIVDDYLILHLSLAL
jgi:hypothetical protein